LKEGQSSNLMESNTPSPTDVVQSPSEVRGKKGEG